MEVDFNGHFLQESHDFWRIMESWPIVSFCFQINFLSESIKWDEERRIDTRATDKELTDNSIAKHVQFQEMLTTGLVMSPNYTIQTELH